MSDQFSWDKFKQMPIVVILRGFNANQVENIVNASHHGGLTNIEITMNTKNAPALIKLAKKTAGENMNVGAGTVCTSQDLEIALEAGAQFIVMPIVDTKIIQTCNDQNIPVFPGAFTPTEVHQAWQAGADMVKIFPANRLGPAYLKDIKGPLSDVKLLPTGGITPENLQEHYDCGADGFGIGGTLANKDKVNNKDWTWIAQQAKKYVDAYNNITKD